MSGDIFLPFFKMFCYSWCDVVYLFFLCLTPICRYIDKQDGSPQNFYKFYTTLQIPLSWLTNLCVSILIIESSTSPCSWLSSCWVPLIDELLFSRVSSVYGGVGDCWVEGDLGDRHVPISWEEGVVGGLMFQFQSVSDSLIICNAVAINQSLKMMIHWFLLDFFFYLQLHHRRIFYFWVAAVGFLISAFYQESPKTDCRRKTF